MKIFKWLVALWVTLALAACGGGGGSAGTQAGGGGGTSSASVPASVEVLTSSTILQSSGETVDITAFVKGSDNVAIAKQKVTFSASSGLLQSVSATTDDNGVATAKLSAGANKANRDITVTVSSGSVQGQVVVSVKGMQLALAGELALKLGASTSYTLKLSDGAGKPVAGAAVVVSSALGNALSASTITTDVAGTATVTYTANKAGVDTITAQALGGTAQQSVVVSAVDVAFVSPAAGAQVPVGTAQVFTVRYLSSGVGVAGQAVAFSTTRGNLLTPASVVTDANGQASVTVQSASAGPATIAAVLVGVGQASIAANFVATVPSTVVMQSSLGAIPPNSGGSAANQSTIEATVRDADGNLVSGKAVNFNIVSDISGGYLSTPTVNTDAYGKAKVQYVAGTSSTAADGVVIRGTVAGTKIFSDVKLTVNASALFINIAYGNTISNLDETTYTKPFSIYVTDATGNPVGSQQVVVSVIPETYKKGYLTYPGAGVWGYATGSPIVVCLNTDFNRNGISDPGETSPLRPGNVAVATPGLLTTDSAGRASFALQYGEQYAWWVSVNITAKATVAGTESRTTQLLELPMSADDATSTSTPANVVSPFNGYLNVADTVCP